MAVVPTRSGDSGSLKRALGSSLGTVIYGMLGHYNLCFLDSFVTYFLRRLAQRFSTAVPWHQLHRAARGFLGICHFSYLSNFHE